MAATPTTATTPDASSCHLPPTPQSTSTLNSEPPASQTTPQTTPNAPLQPSLRLLFSLVPRRDMYFLVFPAILTSMFAGGIAPFMTFVIGQAFDAFADFPVTPNPPQSAKQQLLHSVGITAIELLALAVGALALSSVTSSLWIWAGERNLMAVRKRVYAAVTHKDMVWFDTKMGADESVQTEGDGPVGAGGLMAKFARETDDVRMGSSLAAGYVIQYATTTVTCLILAFTRSWSLTLVILSAVPALMLIQGFSQAAVTPALAAERAQTAAAASRADRALAAIATVKAHNAQQFEQTQLEGVLARVQAAAQRCTAIWGVTSSCAQFVMMAMFVQGFWFGSKLVREGKNSAGDVMAVFWACLIATSNLQMCVPQMIVLNKGKCSMAALLALAESDVDTPAPPLPGTPLSASFSHVGKLSRKKTHLRKIVPRKCHGEFTFQDVSFAYPSRPTLPVLSHISLYLPSHETSFIVGGSGSGKSTIAALLLRMYNPSSGEILLDDQDVAYLDESWCRAHVGAVSQGCVLFDGTVHDNVAIGVAASGSGRKPQDVTRKEVEAVCRAALMHEFVSDLPNGYDTQLGNGGANLSGGQKQRLAIARALLRNPTVLILDEATSALDATSRILVFEAIKRWRRNMATIVITHDLSQVGPEDFVHVLREGVLVEQGFRNVLETFSDSVFRQMVDSQHATGGFPTKGDDEPGPAPVEILEKQEEEREEEIQAAAKAKVLRHQSVLPSRPLTLGNWMFDAVAELTKPNASLAPVTQSSRDPRSLSRHIPMEDLDSHSTKAERRKTLHIDIPSLSSPAATHKTLSHRYSLQFTPVSPSFTFDRSPTMIVDDDEFDREKLAIERSAAHVTQQRTKRVRTRWDEKSLAVLTSVKVEAPMEANSDVTAPSAPQQSFQALLREIYPTVPHKPFIAFGILVCLASGSVTPIFSYLLSRLMYEVSIGAQHVSTINLYGGIVLGVAAADGLLIGLKYYVMETAAMSWVTRIRNLCFRRVLAQDKKWFDEQEHSSARLVQVLIKDGDDARSLIATVLCQSAVVASMLGIGLIWALARGWQLTLVGFAIAPVFALTMVVQTNLVAKCELRSKRAREEVAKSYYDAISNVRAIRAMGFEETFQEKFDQSVDSALRTGVRGAFVEGCSYGVASSLIYLAEALLFYVGAVLIARGTYSYLQMVQVLNLVVFSVSIGSQLMAFTQRIAKSVQATRDFNELLKLSETDAEEQRGVLHPPIYGPISFERVSFAYPARPDVPVLRDLSLTLSAGECIALVGASGSGKSTVAALLQRLYEPASGRITVGPRGYATDLCSTDVHHLRGGLAVVSQQPHLFDASISANIAYGSQLTQEEVRAAAAQAYIADFVESLPQGYETNLGEDASLVSGGQAQRLQLARAVARASRAGVLVLDEATSALDGASQGAVLGALREIMKGRTALVVTHKLSVMQMCDRVVVMQDGRIAEEGTYEELLAKRGVFTQLASGGEWIGDE
ncbi:P-loop containing nucleoside triphosphate hydrolase protein [Obba rivulosa]|uniref:P-loop containing nucleoside triphosphate hydrolase protein n=1 Tax=Obba rivulosa TaxID=1052685 RepID=A0A8E2DRV5_9APHY|nr:P-loop containing nucleoside triphosphate hydrolase protein [Obba rivulosa]